MGWRRRCCPGGWSTHARALGRTWSPGGTAPGDPFPAGHLSGAIDPRRLCIPCPWVDSGALADDEAGVGTLGVIGRHQALPRRADWRERS